MDCSGIPVKVWWKISKTFRVVLMFWVRQGSILGLFLFNKVLADLSLIHSEIDIVNFANSKTSYLLAKNVEHVIEFLQDDLVPLLRWFENNQLKANVDKYHFLVSISQKVNLHVKNFKINKKCKKPLGVKAKFANEPPF